MKGKVNECRVALLQPQTNIDILEVTGNSNKLLKILKDPNAIIKRAGEFGKGIYMIYSNDKRKMKNRLLFTKGGYTRIIYGSFFIARLDKDKNILNLTDNELRLINKIYGRPLKFTKLPNGHFIGYLYDI